MSSNVKSNIDRLPDQTVQVLRNSDLDRILGISRSTRYRLIKKNKFPKPFLISEQSVGWYYSDVLSFLESRSAPARKEKV